MNEKVSVIVPVFNGEKYIEDLIISLRNQTLADIEIIFVDDGSEDKTGEIIKNYIQQDDRIKYFYQKNQGGGAARNLGISKAKGDYLICLDSDDLYENTLIEDLYKQAEKTNADIVICKYKIWNQTTGRISENKGINHKILPKKEVFSVNDVQNILQITNPGPCNKLYRREFVLKNNLKYSRTRIIDDLKFCMVALILAKKITTVNKELSTYRYQIEGSGSKNREQKLANSILVYMETYVEFCARGLWGKYKDLYFNQVTESLKYEISFPVSPMVIALIEGFLFSQLPFANLKHKEIQKLFNIDKIRRNYANYLLLSALCLGKNKNANEKFKQHKHRLQNLKSIGVI